MTTTKTKTGAVTLSLSLENDRERADAGVRADGRSELWRDVQVDAADDVWARDPVSGTMSRHHDLTDAEVAEARRLAGLVRAGTHYVTAGTVFARRAQE